MDRVTQFEWRDINWWVAIRVTRNAGGSLELHSHEIVQATWEDGSLLSRAEQKCSWCDKSEVSTILRSAGELEWRRVLLRVAETQLMETQ